MKELDHSGVVLEGIRKITSNSLFSGIRTCQSYGRQVLRIMRHETFALRALTTGLVRKTSPVVLIFYPIPTAKIFHVKLRHLP
jgi:hypothetical protein